MAQDDDKQCRICLEKEPEQELISPCRCRGGSRFIHRQCLQQWRQENVNESYFRCNECRFEYQYSRVWWGRILEAPWTIRFFTVVLFVVLIMSSGYLSSRVCNTIWYYFMHQGAALAPHRLQILFHGLAWVSLPGFFLFLLYDMPRHVGPLLNNPNALPVIEFPVIFTNDRRYSERRRAPSPKPEAEKKEAEAKSGPRVVTYDPPAVIFWCLVAAGTARSVYHTYGWLRRRVSRMCSQAQSLVENID
jgi:hypothetical protein